jgi:uncharacterized protein YoxC
MRVQWVIVSVGFIALAVALAMHERDTQLQLDSMSARVDELEKHVTNAQSQADTAANMAGYALFPPTK